MTVLGGNYTGALIGAGATLGGALISSSANSDAAATASQAAQQGAGVTSAAAIQAAQIQANANQQALQQYMQFAQQGRDQLNQAKAEGLGAIDAGTAGYANTIAPLLTPNPITIPTYRDLTPQQQTGEQDMLRNGTATLAASGLRGAGRAGVGALMDQDRRYQEDVRSTNDTDTRNEERRAQGVANNARSGLAGIEAQAGGAKANTEVGIGTQIAGNYSQLGSTASNLAQSSGSALANATNVGGAAQAGAINATGQNTAGSDLATGKVEGTALGSLGSIIAGNLSPGPIGSTPINSSSSAFNGAGTANGPNEDSI